MPLFTRRLLLTVALVGGVFPARAERVLAVHKTPGCGCCDGWARHMRAAGFTVTVTEPDDMAGCHTGFIGPYVIEGHVPAAAVERLLSAPNNWAGIAVPGMPIGSPGMEVPDQVPDTYQIWGWRRGVPPARFAMARGGALLPG
jgi:hypothetical protein